MSFTFGMDIFYTLPNLLFLLFKAEKDNGHIELENKKLEKDSKNEQEKEKTENMAKENIPMDSASQMIVKGLSNLGNTCFFNAVMQVTKFSSSLRLYPPCVNSCLFRVIA